MELQTFLDRLQDTKPNSSGYIAPCPAHDDNTPSLAVSEGDDGWLLGARTVTETRP